MVFNPPSELIGLVSNLDEFVTLKTSQAKRSVCDS